MIRTTSKLLTQILLVIGPMLTLQWSLVDWFGFTQLSSNTIEVSVFGLPFTGTKLDIELRLRVIAAFIALVPYIFFEIKDSILPLKDLAEFRTAYLAQEKKVWRNIDPEYRIPDDVRINVMHVGHPWYTFFIGRFYWTWNDGFLPGQKDANMRLFTFQGIAGKAYRKGEPKTIDFRKLRPRAVSFSDYREQVIGSVVILFIIIAAGWLFVIPPWIYVSVAVITAAVYLAVRVLLVDPHHLWPWQIKNSEHLKYILSIPIFRASKGNSVAFKCVGVTNLDTTTEVGADFLEVYEEELIDLFTERGKVIACLR